MSCNAPPSPALRVREPAAFRHAAYDFAVSVHVEQHGRASRCTGARVGGPWILTSKHCLKATESVAVSTTPEELCLSEAFEAETVALHPTADAAILRLDENRAAPRAAVVLGGGVISGEIAWLVGYGLRRGPDAWNRAPIRSRVLKSREDAFLIESAGAGVRIGGCMGDSGAPILGDGDTGPSSSLLGILVAGAESCQGPDKVLPIIALADWLRGFTENGGVPRSAR